MERPPLSTQKTLGQRNISRVATNAQIMDVAFSTMHAEQCGSPEACYSLHRSNVYQYTDVHDKLPRINDFTYLLDLDGLSYSARFHALLASGGAVLKSTIYREFYSDWVCARLELLRANFADEETLLKSSSLFFFSADRALGALHTLVARIRGVVRHCWVLHWTKVSRRGAIQRAGCTGAPGHARLHRQAGCDLEGPVCRRPGLESVHVQVSSNRLSLASPSTFR